MLSLCFLHILLKGTQDFQTKRLGSGTQYLWGLVRFTGPHPSLSPFANLTAPKPNHLTPNHKCQQNFLLQQEKIGFLDSKIGKWGKYPFCLKILCSFEKNVAETWTQHRFQSAYYSKKDCQRETICPKNLFCSISSVTTLFCSYLHLHFWIHSAQQDIFSFTFLHLSAFTPAESRGKKFQGSTEWKQVFVTISGDQEGQLFFKWGMICSLFSDVDLMLLKPLQALKKAIHKFVVWTHGSQESLKSFLHSSTGLFSNKKKNGGFHALWFVFPTNMSFWKLTGIRKEVLCIGHILGFFVSPCSIFFLRGQIGYSFASDMAIDDVSVTQGACVVSVVFAQPMTAKHLFSEASSQLKR